MNERFIVSGVPLPPQDLIIMTKDPETNIRQAKSIASRIEQLAGLGDGLLFDLGCGWGRAAYGLLANEYRGRYVGFDLLPKQIGWLNENFTNIHPSYRFELVDIPKGFSHENDGKKVVDCSAIVEAPVETAIALSVFTHVYEETVLDYTRQVFNLLSPGRPLVFTAFLMNGETRRLLDQDKGLFTVTHKVNDHCFYDKLDAPRQVISYSEDFLLPAIESQGYVIDRVEYGHWRGFDKNSHPEGQDWIVARRP